MMACVSPFSAPSFQTAGVVPAISVVLRLISHLHLSWAQDRHLSCAQTLNCGPPPPLCLLATRGPGSASAAPGTVTRDGDSGTALLGPDGTYSVTEVSPSDVTVGDAGAPAPVYEPAPGDAPAPVYEPAPVVAPVAVEGEVGVNATIPDSDGDAVADADEVTIYGTDPWGWDTDGDGLSDGEELFATRTDPLVWNTPSGGASDGGVEPGATTELVAAEGAAPAASGLDSDNDRLADADEVAIGTDPYTPDADGDGYYDGDEANLGTDPFDPASFPTEGGTAASV
jgi:hypothetical protein